MSSRTAPKSKLALLAVVAALTAAIVVPLTMAGKPAAAAVAKLGQLNTITPTRMLDTRSGIGRPGPAPLASLHAFPVPMAGRLSIPAAASVSAVVLNVTVTNPLGSGYLTVYPDGQSRPLTSSLNFVKGQTVANAVIVPIGSNGYVDFYNGSGGSVHVIADISGYYSTGVAASVPGVYGALPPVRLLDTRTGNGAPKAAVGSLHALGLTVVNRGGVPASGVSAVVLNVTVTAPAATGYITAYPDGSVRPTASNLNFVKGQTVPNLVVAPVGADGKVNLFNGSGGPVSLIADVAGYYLSGTPSAVPAAIGSFGALSPARLLDTRKATGTPSTVAIAPLHSVTLNVNAGHGGVPTSGTSAVVLNVTATAPTGAGYITVYPASGTRPTVSSLNFTKGQTVPNLVVAPVGTGANAGQITFYNGSGGTVHLIADVSGYYRSTALTAPTSSVSHYVRTVLASGDVQNEGCTDATANHGSGSHVVLLDVGGQFTLTGGHGVELTGTETKLLYPALVTALTPYLVGYANCNTGSAAATIAIGTNNDGSFATYNAATMGADWASLVVEPLILATPAGHGITVVGANDIEPGFVSTEAQAESWITNYLGNTSAGLIFNGSADGCPTAVGATGGVCAFGWTQAQFYKMGRALGPGRIQVLPQIYNSQQAMQWENITLTGGGGIDFAGSLTERAACGAACSLLPDQGWDALRYALSTSTLTATKPLPYSTDLKIS